MGSMITQEQSERLYTLLENMMAQTESEAVFLCDRGGYIVNKIVSKSKGETDQTIAALASGSFAATNELASLIGETQFHSIYHKGDSASIYMQSVGQEYLILVIFGENTTVGLVKLYVDKTGKDLEVLLSGLGQKPDENTPEGKQVFMMSDDANVFAKKDDTSDE